jgi:hypothetical protein
MAHTWEILAKDREERLLREQRIAELGLAVGDSGK